MGKILSLAASRFGRFVAAHIALALFLSASLADLGLTPTALTLFLVLFFGGSRLIGALFRRALPDMATAWGGYFDIPAGTALLKEWYDDQKVENLAYDDNPFLVMVPKKTNATGKYIPVPIIWEVNGGRSSQFVNAQGNQTPGQFADFLLTLKPDYDIATLGNQAMEASGDDRGAFLDFATVIVDLAIQGAANSQASSLFRAGTGTIGQISSITAGGVITLTNPADVSQFSNNQVLQANSTDGGTPRAAVGYVIGRNVMSGTITVSNVTWQGAAGLPSGWLANDFLLVQGDNNSKLSGLAAWLPSTAPSASDNFFGVNRSPDSRLYGLFYNGAQQAIEEAVIDAALINRREKGRPRHLITNFGSMSSLLKALGTRREYVDWKMEDAEISFPGVKINGPAGAIECYADRSCQAATGFLLQMPTWKLYSLGPVPKIFRYKDGLEMLRLGNADAMELRVGAYSQLGCSAPGWNSQIAFQS
jgi:hypothetical protein